MMPLGNERINSLWVAHHDKGRTELHFVVPRIDLKTRLALNISPPGKQNQELYRLFGAMMNDHFGFAQVTPLNNDTGLEMKAKELESGSDASRFKLEIHRQITN
ncbi:relaxase/mobilization nuclease domain-containing protein [Burkholderia anthina]|uniref:relaxase/mobilization nuclease domain-containing protein n=1 Tax=Burkholderia anthina TaxID=179879 RepID=UPI001CF18F7B|nr:relaxase/mobilization nuclease domain-containing protein [Burkholderia anthina]MCA8093295.1 relaxase/mobilization nuclease domain-containing protein [Burkholderia anthina]